jgi:hypothetical protein
MRQISEELLQKIASALTQMTGLSYVQVQGLLNELSSLPEVKSEVPKEIKK